MKTLTFFLALSLQAAPLTFSYEGAYQPITNGIFVNLQNHTDPAFDTWVTIIASQPLEGFSAHFNNLPHGVGSGFVIYLDDTLVLNTGLGKMVDNILTFTSSDPFTRIRIETNWMPYWYERGTIHGMNGTIAEILPPEDIVEDGFPPPETTAINNPEPSTILMGIPALLFCVWGARRRRLTTAGE